MTLDRRTFAIAAALAAAAPSAFAAASAGKSAPAGATATEFQLVVDQTEKKCVTALQTNVFQNFWPIYLSMCEALNQYVAEHKVNLASPAVAWVVKNSAFSIYRRGGTRYIGPKYRIFSGTKGELDDDWRAYMVLLDAASKIPEGDGFFDAPADEVRKVLVQTEVFTLKYPTFIRRQEALSMLHHWASWFIADPRNTQFDANGHLRTPVRQAWVRFLEDNPSSVVHPVLLKIYMALKDSGFKRDPKARTDLKPLDEALTKYGWRE